MLPVSMHADVQNMLKYVLWFPPRRDLDIPVNCFPYLFLAKEQKKGILTDTSKVRYQTVIFFKSYLLPRILNNATGIARDLQTTFL